MIPASELKVTRMISTPEILKILKKTLLSLGFSENTSWEKRHSLRTCGDIIESNDSDERQKSINNKQRDYRTREGIGSD
jgi:hypothetical protein